MIDTNRKLELSSFLKNLKIRFRDLTLLNLAFTHRSVPNFSQTIYNNERLEFLGDSVLGLSVTDYLYSKFPDLREGDLAKIKSYVVSEEVLSKIGLSIGLDQILLVGKGEEYSGGRQKNAILEDALEALFGAYYLDSGYKKCKKFVLRYLIPEIDLVIKGDYRKDYKTILQEAVQKKEKVCPKYKLLSKNGPDHAIEFVYQVFVKNTIIGTGSGKNRKSAEQNAAKQGLSKYL
ncbi:MAG: ribonuclease III [Spirochaetaceae bacterium]